MARRVGGAGGIRAAAALMWIPHAHTPCRKSCWFREVEKWTDERYDVPAAVSALLR
ncbi:hypothetical protein [Streptomyces sp. NPDC002825]|uniref:hypothetical protein n=1 Tax=Streptomyces sp. NPDC002825 TaxID=3154666 RepID=UPI00331824D3